MNPKDRVWALLSPLVGFALLLGSLLFISLAIFVHSQLVYLLIHYFKMKHLYFHLTHPELKGLFNCHEDIAVLGKFFV